MSDETPRRVKNQPPEAPMGYRSTRRASKAAKHAKRAERQHQFSTSLGRAGKLVRDVGYYLALTVGGLLVGVLVFLLVATAINGIARWNARRQVGQTTTRGAADQSTRENLLVIGEQSGKATGFLALRVSAADKQIYGIAIPDGAFIEVPGQGFARVGDSYPAGPDVSMSAISNYLTVPFRAYVVVPAAVYQQAVKSQSVAPVLGSAVNTNLTPAQRSQLERDISAVPKANTALVPLPVQPVKLGSTTYFEPQKAEVADLLTKWWGVDPNKVAQVTRVILYNGAGIPGIAGEAAQQLIRAGLRVVDTKNADNFNYVQTLVLVQRGPVAQGNEVASVLGVGQVRNQPSDQDIADVIVIVGKDYKPPAAGASGGTK